MTMRDKVSVDTVRFWVKFWVGLALVLCSGMVTTLVSFYAMREQSKDQMHGIEVRLGERLSRLEQQSTQQQQLHLEMQHTLSKLLQQDYAVRKSAQLTLEP